MSWPESVDVLDPEHIEIHVHERSHTVKDANGWIRCWYGCFTKEASRAKQVLRKIIGRRNKWTRITDPTRVGGRVCSILAWAIFEDTTKEEIAEALNEMNRQLGYNCEYDEVIEL